MNIAKFAAILSVLCLSLCFVACDGEDDATEAPSATLPTESQTTDNGATETPSDEPSEEDAAPVFRFELTEGQDGYILVGTDASYKESHLVIPALHQGKPVVAIGERAFQGAKKLVGVSFEEGSAVSLVEKEAFADCPLLASIVLPESVSCIEVDAFDGCSKLQFTNYENAKYLGTAENPYAFLIEAKSISIMTVTVHKDTTLIADVAFKGCSKLASVSFEEGCRLLSLGDEAFANCSALTTATVPNTVRTAGDGIFKGCRKLTAFPFGAESSLTALGASAFQNCAALTAVSLPASVTALGEYAFKGCTALQNFSLFEGSLLTAFGDEAFAGCKALTDLEIPNTVTTVGDDVIAGCTALVYAETADARYLGNTENPYVLLVEVTRRDALTLTVPDETRAVYQNAFAGCEGLTALPFSSDSQLTSVGKNAFADCVSLESAHFPEGVRHMGVAALKGCGKITSVSLPFVKTVDGGEARLFFGSLFGATSYTEQEAFLPRELTSVTIYGGEIAPFAFYDCRSIETLVILDGVTAIGDFAFMSCEGLTGIDIPASVESIGAYVFLDCAFLTRIEVAADNPHYIAVDDMLIDLKNHVLLKGCGGGTIPDEICIESIAPFAFYGVESLTAFDIPQGVKSIGESAFALCISLEEISFPEGLRVIGTSAFEGCTALVGDIVLPSSVREVRTRAFYGCAAISSFSVQGEGQLQKIGESAFFGCSALTAAALPATVEEIGEGAFSLCPALQILTVEEGNRTYVSLSNAVIERASGTLIGGCGGSVIPDDGRVKAIGRMAFYGCPFERIEIPSSVTRIQTGAFGECLYLEEVVYGGKQSEWEKVVRDADWIDGAPFYSIRCSDGLIY